jgi:hypothetical protein
LALDPARKGGSGEAPGRSAHGAPFSFRSRRQQWLSIGVGSPRRSALSPIEISVAGGHAVVPVHKTMMSTPPSSVTAFASIAHPFGLEWSAATKCTSSRSGDGAARAALSPSRRLEERPNPPCHGREAARADKCWTSPSGGRSRTVNRKKDPRWCGPHGIRQQALLRDRFTCQRCDCTPYNMIAVPLPT